MEINKAFIGTNRYITDKKVLTSSYGYEGDTVYLVSNDDAKKIKAIYGKINGEWRQVESTGGSSGGSSGTVDEELQEQVNQNTADISALNTKITNVTNDVTTAKELAQSANNTANSALSSIDNKLDKVVTGNNLFNKNAIVEGYVKNGVNAVANPDYFITATIPVDVSKGSLFCGIARANGELIEQKFRFACFTLDDGKVKYFNNVSVVEIPSNAVSFTGTFANSVKDKKIYIGYGTTCTGVTYEESASFNVINEIMDLRAETTKLADEIGSAGGAQNSIANIMKPVFTDGSSIQIKLIGDSITMGAQGTGVNDNDSNNDLIYTTSNRSYYENKAGHCWANNLRDYFNTKFGCTVKNYGITGSTSWAILNYIDQIVRDEDDICIVCIGVNDRVKTAKDTTYTQIKKIYNAITEKGKKCILMSEIPVSASNESKYDTQDFHSEDIDIIYQRIATELNIEYIPLYKLMNNYVTEHAITIDSLLAPDGLHPNDTGYDVMFELISNALGVATKFNNPSEESTFSGINTKIDTKTQELNTKVDNKLDKSVTSENLYRKNKIYEGYVRNGVNRTANENYFTTEDIPVDPSKGSLFCGIANSDNTLTAQNFRFALFTLADGTTQYSNNVSTIEIPSNAVSFTGTFANSVKENKVYIGYGTSCEGVTYQLAASFDILEQIVDVSDATEQNSADISILKSNSEKQFELIDTITVTEENTAKIDKSGEPDGTAYNFEKIYVELALEASDAAHPIVVSVNSNKAISYASNGINTTKRYICAYGLIINGLLIPFSSIPASATASHINLTTKANAHIGVNSITSVTVKTGEDTTYIPVGSVIKIYAVRR